MKDSKPYSAEEIIKAVAVYGFGVQLVIITLPIWIWPVLLYQVIFYCMKGVVDVINHCGISKFEVKVVLSVMIITYFLAMI